MPRSRKSEINSQKSENVTSRFSVNPQTLKQDRRFYIVLLIIGLLLLAFYKKSWFVAATVNGMPISNFELLSHMNQQYRAQTLNQMINEKLILAEANKAGVTVNKQEVDTKISQLENNLGGAQTLDSLLSQQGMNRPGLRDQLKIQLIIEKLYSKDATVSAEEVDKFIEENKDTLKATDSAKQKEEAESSLKQQKLTQIFNEKFGNLRQSAKINIY